MSEKFKPLWRELNEPTPAHLEAAVLRRLGAAKRRALISRLIGFGAVSLGALGGLIISLNYLLTAISQSGFYEYLSLALTDQTAVLTYWRELGLSLTESLPILAFTSVFALLAVLLWTVPKNISLIYDYTQTA